MPEAVTGETGKAGRPVVIEIVGAAGAGKSTLAANIARWASGVGYEAADTRSTRRQSYGLGERLAAWARALPEFATASAFVARKIGARSLPVGAVTRLGPALQHSRQLRLLLRRMGANSVIVQEPGWLMDLLTQYVHAARPLDESVALSYIGRGPRIDFAVVLRVSPGVALGHMQMRKRGLPKSFQELGPAALDEVLRRGDDCAATIAAACRTAGIQTLELDVDGLDAEAVTQTCAGRLLPFLGARLDTPHPN
jgi:hypothetical protein